MPNKYTKYMEVPTTSKEITANGVYDVTKYASAVIKVAGMIYVSDVPPEPTQGENYDLWLVV